MESKTLLRNISFGSQKELAMGILLLLGVLGITRILFIRYRTGLRNIPGPFLASISDLDRLWSCFAGQQMNYHLKLHEKYGPLVRIGPKHVSFSNGSLIPLVYSISTRFWKSEFYDMFHLDGTSTTFSERDEMKHRTKKRPVAGAYSMSTMKELEPMNDECSDIFIAKLEGLAGKDIDLGQWLHWYAFDLITTIAFSNRLGFMELETDVQGVIKALSDRLKYVSTIGQAPYLHKYLLGNRLVSWVASVLRGTDSLPTKYLINFIMQQVQCRVGKDSKMEVDDLLGRFKRFKDGEQVMDDTELMSHAAANVLAGSDTTAATLRALFYNLCRNSEVHDKLLFEVDEAVRNGQLSDPVTFEEARQLKYLQAVLKESLRIHPAIGLLLERVVPAGGAEIGGVWLPEGTIVGINPWVAAREQSVYGDDVFTFRPERWLEADAGQLKLMERNFLSFGGGSRTCLGKNVSLLEMSKLVPQLLMKFDFELTDPSREWTLHDYLFVGQTGLICKIMRRSK
ncbi:hypothetical protein Daus18300_008064 [Diaporthe australafricana]|uniref:Pisatin demethylase n=1 Tax=Diaporthe australafricana TaxID=127596 RepID=A0ABR3WK19_9PEZI